MVHTCMNVSEGQQLLLVVIPQDLSSYVLFFIKMLVVVCVWYMYVYACACVYIDACTCVFIPLLKCSIQLEFLPRNSQYTAYY